MPTLRTWNSPRATGLSNAMLDRLKLDDQRIPAWPGGSAKSPHCPIRSGKILDERVRPTACGCRKSATPIGVVVIIYESRPNVTADAASLCFKSGNATIFAGRQGGIKLPTR